jgi:hypothetical protein
MFNDHGDARVIRVFFPRCESSALRRDTTASPPSVYAEGKELLRSGLWAGSKRERLPMRTTACPLLPSRPLLAREFRFESRLKRRIERT